MSQQQFGSQADEKAEQPAERAIQRRKWQPKMHQAADIQVPASDPMKAEGSQDETSTSKVVFPTNSATNATATNPQLAAYMQQRYAQLANSMQGSTAMAQISQLRMLQQTNPAAYAKYLSANAAYTNYYKQMLMRNQAAYQQRQTPSFNYSSYVANASSGKTTQQPIEYNYPPAESPTAGLSQRFKDARDEYTKKMIAKFKEFEFKGTAAFWGEHEEEMDKVFNEWRDGLDPKKGMFAKIEDIPDEQLKILAMFMHERDEPLTEIADLIMTRFKMEAFLTKDQMRQLVLKIATRRAYGVKPYYNFNEFEIKSGEDITMCWEANPVYLPRAEALKAKEDRTTRKKTQTAVWNYWLFMKRLRTTRRGDERERMLQAQIDKIQQWESRKHDAEERKKARNEMWAKNAKQREELKAKRTEEQLKKHQAQIAQMAQRQQERAAKETERRKMKNQKLSAQMAKAIEKGALSSGNLNKSQAFGLEHFIDATQNVNLSRRKGVNERKFLPFVPEFGAIYSNNTPPTLPKYFDLFLRLTYDQATEQLLLYRTKGQKKQSDRCNGTRREDVWCYRHFHTDYRPPWSGIEKRSSKKVFGRRPFAKDDDEKEVDYDGEDSGVEWYGDVDGTGGPEESRETTLAMDTDGEGEDIRESEEEEFSDDDPHDGLRADGYEDDGFLDDAGDVFFPKTRKKEDRFPIRPNRTRGDKDPSPITLLLPPCMPSNHLDKKADLHPFHKFLQSRGELIARRDAEVVCHDDKIEFPTSVNSWRTNLIKKRKAAWITKKKKRKRASSLPTKRPAKKSKKRGK